MEPARVAAGGLPSTLHCDWEPTSARQPRGLDRVTGRHKLIGKGVIRTARIEAVTPVGRTYVTEQFAAALHATSRVGHACEYVGLAGNGKGVRSLPDVLAPADATNNCAIAQIVQQTFNWVGRLAPAMLAYRAW